MTNNPPPKIADFSELFEGEEFVESRNKKKEFEQCPSDDTVAKTLEYTKSAEYKEKNFARKALTVNPAKACQPLGAVYAAAGFEGCLPYVHGSQGCAAYFRSHFNRHFKEPFATVSDSMTEDAAVFGGHKNMAQGLKNALAIYKPKMIAVCTSCMAEVIGDDLNGFIGNSKKEGSVPDDFPVPFAHTPSFIGSHLNGYDQMIRGVLYYFTREVEKTETDNGTINIIPGFDGFCVGNIPEIKRILDLMKVDYNLLGDNSDILNTPMDGSYRMYAGGTSVETIKASKNAKATFALLPDSLPKATSSVLKSEWGQPLEQIVPLGLSGTDNWLMKVSEVTGKAIPEELTVERGRALDAMADSNYYLHGKRFSIFGDPSYVEALVDFYMEMGAEPLHIVSSNGKKKWGNKLQKKLAATEFGKNATVHHGADLWHMRSLVLEDKPDFIVGSTHGKQLARDAGVPLIRIGFPIFDRHHLHRYPVFGYSGLINILSWTVNTLLDEMDRNAESYNFDMVR